MTKPALSLAGVLVLAACSTKQPAQSTGTGGTTTSTGTAGAAGGGGAGPVPVLPVTPGEPLTTPSEQWTWVPFPGASCGNGSPTGIGVNLSTKSSRVLLYLEAGGACWSDITCNTIGTAANFSSGYDAKSFAAESTDPTYLAQPGGFFDRASAANPFQDYSYVYVPYCTGDIHAGAAVVDFTSGPASFVGYNNLTQFLDRVVPTFPAADRVILAGSSAGGFGAMYNWWHVQQAFGKIRVDVIDDSGTPMPPDVPIGNLSDWIATWNLAATAPTGCPTCLQSLAGFLGFYQLKYPDHDAALLSFAHDSTLPAYFMVSQQQFDMGLQEDLATYVKPGTSTKAFIAAGAGHVLWFTPTLTTGGVTLQQFVTRMVTDDPTWATQM
jgi:hypothetical protein